MFVEPPKAMSHSMALWMAAALTMSRARTPFSRSSMTFMPARFARRMRSEYTAGTVPLPGSAMPRASHKQFIEFAVKSPEQLPQVGQAWSSWYFSSSSVIVPACTRPAPSKSVLRSVEGPRPPGRVPASIGPPDTNTVGMFTRSAPKSIPGTTLSQLGMHTIASKAWPCTAHSTLSAMTSRDTSE